MMLADFGYAADWQVGGVPPAVQVQAIFDADYRGVDDTGLEQTISSVGPTLLVHTEDLPAGADQGDLVSPNAPNALALYEVIDMQPDPSDGMFTRVVMRQRT
jgi:hypothetical protein